MGEPATLSDLVQLGGPDSWVHLDSSTSVCLQRFSQVSLLQTCRRWAGCQHWKTWRSRAAF